MPPSQTRCCMLREPFPKGAVFLRHNYCERTVASSCQRNKNMNIWHKRFLIAQILVLLVCTVAAVFTASQFLLPGMIFFFFLEFGTLEAQRRENPKAVLYHKGCFFALIDLVSVLVFLVFFILHVYSAIQGGEYFTQYYPVLFLYIALRKLYILKNYSYEI